MQIGDELLKLIQTRRSIRKYKHIVPEWEKVTKVVEAGRFAPSSGNLQNWKFVLVTQEPLRKAITEASLEQYWMLEAPIFIVLCAFPEHAEKYYGVRGARLYTIQNCAAAATLMQIQAHSLGLATCWIGAFDEDTVKSILRIEEYVRPQIILTLGYAKEEPAQPVKYPLDGVIYYERWFNRIRDSNKYYRDYAVKWKRQFDAIKNAIKTTSEKVKDKFKKQ